ncbi:BTAD domain-containing putative transcriptional regulator [Plantactinospora solaniradicis]|uniref:BTAD domain-containing putative transcriptional regulator n=1 Tax=Plantactinospora solaniradicis TaxID=1723736 RepID=A0ABW1KDK9_9ACTN
MRHVRGLAAIGDQLRSHRIRAGLTQREVAVRSGISVRALRDIEHNRVGAPRPAALGRLATTLGLSDAETAALLAGLRASGSRPGPGAARPWVGVLGPLAVQRGGAPVEVSSRMQGDLLGLVAIQPGRVVSTDEIVDVLWGEKPPRSCRRLVHTYVAQVRDILEPGRHPRVQTRSLCRVRSGYRLDLDGDELDLGAFTRLTERAAQARAAGDVETATGQFGDALDLWRGPVLAGAGERLRQHPPTVAVARQRLAAALSYGELAIGAGRHDEAVDRLGAVLDGEPLHEGLAARLILALAGSGGQAAALARFAEVRDRLASELGIEPGAELHQAHLRVLRGQVPAPVEHRPPAPAMPAPEPPRVRHPPGSSGDDVPAPPLPRAGPEGPAPAALPAPPPAQLRAPVTPRQLPAAIRHFAGRAREMAQLDELADEAVTGRRVVVAAVDGPGGVGKTTLVTQWAHGAAERFPDGQLFVNLRGFSPAGAPVTTSEAVRGFLDALGVAQQRVPADADAQVGLFRSVLADRRVLIVLDNARDAEQVRPLIPGSGTALVVVTSRRRLTLLVAVEDAHPLPLGLLTDAEARDMVDRRLGAARTTARRGTVDDLVRRCAGLPLALCIVCAHVSRRSLPRRSGTEWRGELDSLSGIDASTDVRAVVSWSYRGLGAGAGRLFRLLGLHPGADVGTAAVASLLGEPVATTRARVAELVDTHLVEELAPGRFTVHDLLRSYAADLAHEVDSEADRAAARHRMFDHYLHSAHAANTLILEPHLEPIRLEEPPPGLALERPPNRAAATAWFAVERQVLLSTVDEAAATGFDGHAWRIAWSLITFLNRRGLFAEQLRVQRTALAAADRVRDPVGRAHALRAIGGARTHLGHHREAREDLLAALREFEALADINGQTSVHFGLSFLNTLRGEHRTAMRHSGAALDLCRMVNHLAGQASALNSTGWHHARLGEFDEAVEFCSAALEIHREVGDVLGEAHTLDSLGVVHQGSGEHETALDHFRQAFALFDEFGDTYLMATVLDHIGDSEQALGRSAAARAAWRRSLELLDGAGHPDADQVRTKLTGGS